VKVQDGNRYNDFYVVPNGTRALIIQYPRNTLVKPKLLEGKEKGRTVLSSVKFVDQPKVGNAGSVETKAR
jgi:hypothetical protein